MRAAIYGRKSDDRADSVDVQLSNARAFAQSKGWHVVSEFKDVDISGAEFLDRPGFNALLAAVKSPRRPFDVVVTMNVDRFGRETYRTNLALLDIAEAGCRIFTYSDGQEVKVGSPIEKQMVSLRNYAAEDYREQIASKTKEAMKAKAKAGHVVGKRTYGYDHVNVGDHAERRVNAAEAEVIRRVFELSASGYGNLAIVNRLRADKVPAMGPRGWSKQVIRTLLANKLYIGVVEFGKSRSAARGGSAYRRERSPKDEWTVVTRPELRIVSDALWSEVQRRKAKTAATYVRTSDGRLLGKPASIATADHRLSGIAKCGVCGGSLVFARKNAKTLAYYCTTRIHRGSDACSNSRGVPEKKLVFVAGRELTYQLDPEQLEELYNDRYERLMAEYKAQAGERAHLEAEAARLETDIARGVAAVMRGASAAIEAAVREAEAKLADLKSKLAEPVPDVDWAELRKRLAVLNPMLDGEPVVFRQAMAKAGVSQVVVTPAPDGGWDVEGRADLTRLFFGNFGGSGGPYRPPII